MEISIIEVILLFLLISANLLFLYFIYCVEKAKQDVILEYKKNESLKKDN